MSKLQEAGFVAQDSPLFLNTYGYKFRVTKNHVTAEQLQSLKREYDVVGTEALAALDSLFPPPPPRAGWYAKNKAEDAQPDRDTYALLRDNHEKEPKMQALWDEVNAVPSWVDWEQIKRGQEVFYRYALGAIAGFAFQGLLASTGSSYRPAETLVRTGGHSVKLAKHRLFETFQIILQVTKSLDNVKPGGDAFASAIRVRLLHASVRNRILKLEKQRPGYFNIAEFGVPINKLDSMQSICAFSTNLVWLALPRQGIHVRRQEALDYLALWRWVGYVLGVPYDVLETPERAHATMESMLYDCMKPTNNSRALARNLITALDGVAPIYAPREFFEAGSRYINGDELCDDIGLQRPGLYWQAVIRGQCWLLALVTYISRSIPPLDRRMIESNRNLFWSHIVENEDALNGEYKYEFKYVPQLDEKMGIEKQQSEAVWRGTTTLERVGFYSFLAVALSAVAVSGGSVAFMLHLVGMI